MAQKLKHARDLLLGYRLDHETAVARFEWPEMGERYNWAIDWFDVIAQANEQTALIVVEENGREIRRSFDQMFRRSNQLARFLLDQGVKKGESVLLTLGNQVELWESMLAVMKVGAVIVPTTTILGSHDLADRIERASVQHLIVNASDVEKYVGITTGLTKIAVGDQDSGWKSFSDSRANSDEPIEHPGTASNDPLLLYFTSGTTNQPKVVEHTQTSYPVGHLSSMYWMGLQPDDIHLNISSPGWAKHAWSSFFAPWLAQATIVVFNYSRFNAPELLDIIDRLAITTFCAPPTVWRMLISSDLSVVPRYLREVVSAGEPLNPEVIHQVQDAWKLTIRDGFGQTETTALIGNSPGSVMKPGSMGRPLPGCPVVLVDPASGLQSNEGEICVDLQSQAVFLMAGYLGDPDRNAEAHSGELFHTGDFATRDADGYITYVGRKDDVFKASDYKISPFELESVLIEHPAVLEAAVVPAPDAVRQFVPKAYVTLTSGTVPSGDIAFDIFRHAYARLAPFQRIKRLEFSELPKTVSGKIRRVELRIREEALANGQGTTAEWRSEEFPDLGR
jgi:acetyl-CoA synthetase